MKKTLLVTIAFLTLAQTSFALTVKPGNYSGQDSDGYACTLSISKDGYIGLFYKGAWGDGLAFIPKSSRLEGNTLTVSGSADMGAGKAQIELANDGTPVQAKMGVGPMVKFFYDVTCENLRSSN